MSQLFPRCWPHTGDPDGSRDTHPLLADSPWGGGLNSRLSWVPASHTRVPAQEKGDKTTSTKDRNMGCRARLHSTSTQSPPLSLLLPQKVLNAPLGQLQPLLGHSLGPCLPPQTLQTAYMLVCLSLWLKGSSLAVSQGPWTKQTLGEFPPNRSNPKVLEGWVLTLAQKNQQRSIVIHIHRGPLPVKAQTDTG